MTSTTLRRLAATCCCVVIGAVAAGCGGDSSSDATTVVVTSAGTTAGTTAAAALTLEQRVPTSAEFALYPVDATSVVELDDFVGAVSDGDDADTDRASLTSAGFTRGALSRYDTGDDQAYALAFVAEVSAASAPGLVDTVIAQFADSSDEPNVITTTFTVDEAGGAQGVEATGTTTDGTQVTGTQILFVDGAYVYGLQLARQGTTPVTTELRAAVASWRSRVAGAPAAPETPTTTTGATTTTAPATTTTDTTAGDAFPNAGEVEVLSKVPAATADDCVRTSDEARAGKATASVRCETGTHRVYYEAFATAADAQESYQGYLTAQDIERGEGQTCDDGAPAEGTWNGPDDRVACFIDAGSAWVVWNSTELKLVAVAIDPDGNLQRVFDWWKSADSGPIV